MNAFARTICLALFIVLATASTVSAGSPAPQNALAEIRGHLPGLAFSLIDENGSKVTAEDYEGEVVLLFFGFTSCPSVCPATVARLVRTLATLSPQDAARTEILFVTVDPARDTPPVLKGFTTRYAPARVTGLTGAQKEIAALARRYRAAYRPAGPADQGSNADRIVHSAAVYLFDQEGKARYLITPYDKPGPVAAAIKELARERP